MTATATRPAPGAGVTPGTGARPGGTRPPAEPRSYVGGAEVALVLLTLATIFGFGRVFASWSFFGPMAITALYTHAGTWFGRRRGWSVSLTALATVVGLVVLLSWVFFFGTTLIGIPTAETFRSAREALQASWEAFQNVTPPAPPLTGFVMASCAALYFAVFLADWAAFRLWSAFEAIVPASTLFIFCSLLGSNQYQLASSLVFAAALLLFLLLHRVARQESSAGWLTADIARGSRSLAVLGTVIAAVAVLLGGLLGPRLPGAGSPPLASWRGQDTGPGQRTTISPLVDIQDRLVSQSNVELFTVTSSERAYWRMTSLDTFDGQIWRSGGKYTSVDGDLDGQTPPGVDAAQAQQDFTIENLKVLWLPAAYQPRSITSPKAEVRYQADSATLIVDTNVSDSDGLAYSVKSAIPHFTEAELAGAETGVPNEIRNRYLALPDNFSAVARQQAARATKDAATPYAKALALQDFFQDGSFTYDLAVPKGHGENAIEEFLAQKRGYCEQFAGTYAAMARSLGLPARVAVGFTPGEQDPTTGAYRVRGEHAHAWPEVYLGQYGWVAFEPTPGRGMPNAEYTGLPEQQDTSGPADTPTTVPTSATAPTSVVTSLVPAPPGSQPQQNVDAGGATDEPAAAEEQSPAVRILILLTEALLLAALAAGAYALVIILLKRSRRAQRRAGATDANSRVRVAWDESVEALAVMRTAPDPAETHEEFANRASPLLDAAGRELVALAHDVDAATYAPQLLDDDTAARAEQVATDVRTVVRAKTPGRREMAALLDPRPVLPKRRGAQRHRAGSAN